MAFRKISIRKDCDRCLLLRSAIDENNRRSGLWFKWNFGVGEGMDVGVRVKNTFNETPSVAYYLYGFYNPFLY